MVREVLSHVTRSPSNYIPGLRLLSHLLPLPLPLPSARPLAQAESSALLAARALWSAHLHSLEPEIGRIVGEVSGLVYPPLLQLLRRVVDQLSSLAPPTASCVLTAVLGSCQAALTTKNLVVSARQLSFLCWLVGAPHLKAVMNNLLTEQKPRTEFCRTLELSFTQGSTSCQQTAISVLQRLCDPELSLRTLPSAGAGGVEAWEQYLADSVPDGATLAELMTVLLNPFTCELRTNFSIQLLTMRTFIMFTETDFTFSILKLCLNTKNRTLFSFLRKLSVDLEPEKADCIPCLAAVAEFLTLLKEGTDGEGRYPGRSKVLTLPELAWVVQYTLPQGYTLYYRV